MKYLKNLGKALTSYEQKAINGGSARCQSHSDCGNDLVCGDNGIKDVCLGGICTVFYC